MAEAANSQEEARPGESSRNSSWISSSSRRRYMLLRGKLGAMTTRTNRSEGNRPGRTGNSRPMPWRCLPWTRSATPRRKLGGPPSVPPMPWSWPGLEEEPELPAETALGLRLLQAEDTAIREARLVARYYTRQGSLHGHCFYMGAVRPPRGHRAPDPGDVRLHHGCRGAGSQRDLLEIWPESHWPGFALRQSDVL